MGRKKKNRGKSIATDLPILIQRQLERGDAKEALKNAKVFYRQRPDEVAKQLLQRTYLARTEQLFQTQNLDLARGTLAELLSLGPLPDSFHQQVSRLSVLLGVGGNGQGPAKDGAFLDASPELKAELADQCVLVGPAPNHPEDVRQLASEVRTALEAIEAAQPQRAETLLNPISRNSPFADWKLFARGLAAYYDHDHERMTANWSRLDPQRPAHRIAQALLILAKQATHQDVSPAIADRLRMLSTALDEGRVCDRLHELDRHIQRGDWRAAVRELRNLVARLQASEAPLVEQITDLLWRHLLKEERYHELEELTRCVPGPAWDPHFHRARALMAEEELPREHVEGAWLDYIHDLQHTIALADRERELAIALVYERLADQIACEAARYKRWLDHHDRELDLDDDDEYEDEDSDYDDDDPFYDEDEDEDDDCDEDDEDDGGEYHRQRITELVGRADEYFQLSLKHDPSLREVYLNYAAFLAKVVQKPARAGAVYRDYLRRYPDDFDTLIEVANHCLEQQQPELAKVHALRALQLRPRDDRAANCLWAAAIGASRQAALRARFDTARAELDVARTVVGKDRSQYLIDACRAAVELKADDTQQAEQLIEATIQQCGHPAAGLLVVTVQAIRCRVAQSVRRDLNRRFKEALGGCKTSQAAGIMASFLNAMDAAGISYVGKKTHIALVEKFLKKCVSLRWEPLDLAVACEFFFHRDPNSRVLGKLLRIGLRSFREYPQFHFLSAFREMAAGPYRCNHRTAIQQLKTAIQLSKTSQHPLTDKERETATQALIRLEKGPMALFDSDDPYEDDEDDEDDDNEADEDSWTYQQDDAWLPDAGQVTEQQLRQLLNSMPARLKEFVRRMAREAGLSEIEFLRQVLADGANAFSKTAEKLGTS